MRVDARVTRNMFFIPNILFFMEGAKIYLTRLLPKPSKLASFHKGGAQSCTNNWLQVNEI